MHFFLLLLLEFIGTTGLKLLRYSFNSQDFLHFFLQFSLEGGDFNRIIRRVWLLQPTSTNGSWFLVYQDTNATTTTTERKREKILILIVITAIIMYIFLNKPPIFSTVKKKKPRLSSNLTLNITCDRSIYSIIFLWRGLTNYVEKIEAEICRILMLSPLPIYYAMFRLCLNCL